MAHQTEDDGFHEIQLNGKQLVFLFMAATVVSVVIFLCGVLVGRGVRAERGTLVAEAATPAASVDETPQPAAAPPPAPAAAGAEDPTKAAPPPTVDDLSYPNRLEKPNQPKEVLKKDEKAAKAAVKPAPPPPPAAPAPPASRTASPSTADATGDFTVQIAALNARGEADAIVRRLSSKGYAAYVVPPGNGAVMYRVRVGRFQSRRDAEPTAAKLQKEEQFKPWITR